MGPASQGQKGQAETSPGAPRRAGSWCRCWWPERHLPRRSQPSGWKQRREKRSAAGHARRWGLLFGQPLRRTSCGPAHCHRRERCSGPSALPAALGLPARGQTSRFCFARPPSCGQHEVPGRRRDAEHLGHPWDAPALMAQPHSARLAPEVATAAPDAGKATALQRQQRGWHRVADTAQIKGRSHNSEKSKQQLPGKAGTGGGASKVYQIAPRGSVPPGTTAHSVSPPPKGPRGGNGAAGAGHPLPMPPGRAQLRMQPPQARGGIWESPAGSEPAGCRSSPSRRRPQGKRVCNRGWKRFPAKPCLGREQSVLCQPPAA